MEDELGRSQSPRGATPVAHAVEGCEADAAPELSRSQLCGKDANHPAAGEQNHQAAPRPPPYQVPFLGPPGQRDGQALDRPGTA